MSEKGKSQDPAKEQAAIQELLQSAPEGTDRGRTIRSILKMAGYSVNTVTAGHVVQQPQTPPLEKPKQDEEKDEKKKKEEAGDKKDEKKKH